MEAWNHAGSDHDSTEHKRALRVWTEWFMFAKTCSLVILGGKKKHRNNNTAANRIARWTSGERMSLWNEGLRLTKADSPARSGCKRKRAGDASVEQMLSQKQAEVIDLAQRGLPGKAVRHAGSLGLASDTPETERAMRPTLVEPPAHHRASQRASPPEANNITDEAHVKAIRSFTATRFLQATNWREGQQTCSVFVQCHG